jgi:hypothetical protein
LFALRSYGRLHLKHAPASLDVEAWRLSATAVIGAHVVEKRGTHVFILAYKSLDVTGGHPGEKRLSRARVIAKRFAYLGDERLGLLACHLSVRA